MPEVLRYPLTQPSHTQSPTLRRLRRSNPVTRVTLWNGRRAWLVTRYADARRALSDPSLSADATDPRFPSLNPSQVVPNDRGGLARMIEDRHDEIRKMVANKFTIRAVERWRPTAQRIVDEQIGMLLDAGPPADLILRFALPVPLRLVCHLLGVPSADTDFVQRCGQLIIARGYESSGPALQQTREYVDNLVRRNEEEPGDNLVGQLVREHVKPGKLSSRELADLVLVLLIAGHTTTATTIGLGVLYLLEAPQRYRALHDDPALVAPMVEEFLRFQTVVADGVPRVAKRDLTLGGTLIRAGEAVVISLVSANRDDDVFDDPDTFQMQREVKPQHLAFGWGTHRCLGQHLARMEFRVAFATLARSLPTLRLTTPAGQLRFAHEDKHLPHLYELPVTW